MDKSIKTLLVFFTTCFCLSIQAIGGPNIDHNIKNIPQKSEPENNSSVATELNKLKESNALSPEERARIRRALSEYAKSSGKEIIFIEEKQREMLKGLEARFIACDEDNDNTLDMAETTKCLPQVARQFNHLDLDENEVISLDELALLAKDFEKSHSENNKLENNKRKSNQASSGTKTPI